MKWNEAEWKREQRMMSLTLDKVVVKVTILGEIIFGETWVKWYKYRKKILGEGRSKCKDPLGKYARCI